MHKLVIKYSIVVPIYNAEDYLKECINSVLCQEYQNFELLLINDGSRDSSLIICENFKLLDTRIKVFNQENSGQMMAREMGITQASGDYCLFLDADDYWDKDLLYRINCEISKTNCDLLLFKYKKVNNDGTQLNVPDSLFKDLTLFYEKDKEEIFKILISSFKLNNIVCKVVKRNILLKIKSSKIKNRDIKHGEDLLQSLPMIIYSEKILYLDAPFYNYREVNNSVTNTFNKNLFRDITIVRGILLENLIENNLDNENNLVSFYSFYVKIILKNLYVLSNSHLKVNQKIDILRDLKNTQLYSNSSKYIEIKRFSFIYRVRYIFLNKNQFFLLLQFEKLISTLRRLKK